MSTADVSHPDELAEQAAHWIVLLTDDDAADRERARCEFEAWKRADPRHAAAAAEIERVIGRVQTVRDSAPGDGRPARAALDAIFSRKRRRAKRIVIVPAILAALIVPIGLALTIRFPAHLTADVRTTTGQWDTRVLSDGTRITVGSASAVNLRYDEHRRTVELVRGEILVDVGRDPSRPFVVETAHGSIRALGTRFVVEQRDESTELNMIESRASAHPSARGDGGAVTVHAGERVRITAESVGPIEAIDERSLADAWRYRQLVIADEPLNEVLDRLARYRPGRILYDRDEIAGIRVSAVLPIDDTDRALQLLVNNFPALRVRAFTPYLVWVDAPSP